jgi:hypothetical protein
VESVITLHVQQGVAPAVLVADTGLVIDQGENLGGEGVDANRCAAAVA